MSERFTKDDLAAKVDWEGGVTEAILGYGIRSDALPEDTPAEIVEAWGRIQSGLADIDRIERWLYPEG